jgi:heme o synthase
MATEPILSALDVVVAQPRRVAGFPVLSDYWALTKPEVNFLIVFTTAVAFCMASPAGLAHLPWVVFIHTLLGTILVASGAAALNQLFELRSDAQMRRTARRPVAAGRIQPVHALIFGTLLSLAGIAYLLLAVNILASLLAVGTLLGYLFLYTPLKRVTPLCTLIGAIPGAVPPLIGWAAARGHSSPEAWALFAIVFLWQFPHFMAIAWMYREDYDRAAYLVLPKGEARARFISLQTMLPLMALVPASLLPTSAGHEGILYSVAASLLGLGFFYYGAQFVLHRSSAAARRLLMASIIYLPAVLVLRMLALGGLTH